MIVYQTNDDGFYTGTVAARPSPLEPGEFLIPRNAYTDPPPVIPEGKVARRVKGSWTIENPPLPGSTASAPWAQLPVFEQGLRVDRERTNRIRAGTDLSITGYGQTVRVQLRDAEDEVNLLGQVLRATLLIAAEDYTTTLPWRDGENVGHDLTGPQMLEYGQSVAAWKQSILQASWDLKAMTPIPSDYFDDSRWPA